MTAVAAVAVDIDGGGNPMFTAAATWLAGWRLRIQCNNSEALRGNQIQIAR